MKKIWIGTISNCQICQDPLLGSMVDGVVKIGDRNAWGNICLSCHTIFGIGLGTGKGQRYDWDNQSQQWVKTDG